jgi:hypothetical protein
MKRIRMPTESLAYVYTMHICMHWWLCTVFSIQTFSCAHMIPHVMGDDYGHSFLLKRCWWAWGAKKANSNKQKNHILHFLFTESKWILPVHHEYLLIWASLRKRKRIQKGVKGPGDKRTAKKASGEDDGLGDGESKRRLTFRVSIRTNLEELRTGSFDAEASRIFWS